ncbi:MAG TPA: hypothetical protein DEG43_05270 [Acidimicrobiaceae bacterium]|jgi:hypothetical protein|nr:hypothetical protein [Acidimicrobiaceae bacterium]
MLSEDEERILTEIEQQLRATDPDLARQVGETTVFTESLRGSRLAIGGVVVGLVVTVLLLEVNAVLAFLVGFGLMLAGGVALERSAREFGRAAGQQLSNFVAAELENLAESGRIARERRDSRLRQRDQDGPGNGEETNN